MNKKVQNQQTIPNLKDKEKDIKITPSKNNPSAILVMTKELTVNSSLTGSPLVGTADHFSVSNPK